MNIEVDWRLVRGDELEKCIRLKQLVMTDVNRAGWTPLMSAAAACTKPELIRMLIEAGSKIDEQDKDGMTPLMIAARWNDSEEVITLLLGVGAKAKLKDKSGMKAIDYAKQNDNFKNTNVYGLLKKEK